MTTEQNANTPDPLAGEQIEEQETTITSTVTPAVEDGEQPKEEEKYVDPAKLVEHLDRENAEVHAAADEIAPYTLLSDPSHLQIAEEYRADVQAMVADGVDAVAAESVMHYVLGEHAEAVERDRNAVFSQGEIPGVRLNDPQSTVSYMKKTYGTMAEQIIKDAQTAFRGLPADVQKYLDWDNGDGQILTNSPHLLIALALHENGFTKMSKAQAEVEIQALRSQKQLDALGLAKLKIARHIASRGTSSDHKGLAKALSDKGAPKPQATNVDARIAAIRRDPNYHKTDNPTLHRALVNEMAELYATKSGGQ